MSEKFHMWRLCEPENSRKVTLEFKCPHCNRVIISNPKGILAIEVGGFAYLVGKRKQSCECGREIDIPSCFKKWGDLLRFRDRIKEQISRERGTSSIVLMSFDEALGLSKLGFKRSMSSRNYFDA